MSVERQVHWGQGAFLSPQHLQAQDAWQQANRHALHLRLTPFPWGYEALRLREDVASEPNQREANQRSAPAIERGLFLVPKVIE